MRIIVNGDARELESPTVALALEELGYGGASVATAVNGIFVPVTARSDLKLGDGDSLEVVAPMQGG